MEIKAQHPFWGYRRAWGFLNFHLNYKVSQRKVRKLMKNHGLSLKERPKKAVRMNKTRKPKAQRPKSIWGIDMTKFIVEASGWVYLHIVVDWYTKKIVGFKLSTRSKTQDWLDALDTAIEDAFPDGVRGQCLKLVSDNGSQPTSKSFMKEMNILDIKQIFTAYNNPKGNAETERMIRTIKEELLWLNEFETFEEAKTVLESWVKDYNNNYPHSVLEYRSPKQFEDNYFNKIKKVA